MSPTPSKRVQANSAKKLSPTRALAEDIRRNPRLAPVVGDVLDLLGPFAAEHPDTRVRHVEEFARCTVPGGDSHRAGFVAYTSTGLVLVWKQGFLWRGHGQFIVARPDVTGWAWDAQGLFVDLHNGSAVRIDWLANSAERLGAEEAFNTFKPLPR